jgi:3-hydroxyisobutyrate dehydrogenase
MKKIAFLGLGAMGFPMARNLIKAGYSLRGHDANLEAMARIEALGAKTASSSSETVSDAAIIISMLPNDLVVESVYQGEGGVISSASPGALIIDCSTISVSASRRLAGAAIAAGIDVIDAPVSGGPHGAADATLSFMVGGEAPVIEAARPVLEAMGNRIVHVGGNGAGQTAKICNNMLAAVIMAGAAEALALGARNGIDPARLTEVIQSSSGGNSLMNRWHPWPGVRAEAPSSQDYEGGFQLELMLKDLGLAIDNAGLTKAAIPLGALARNLYALRAAQSIESLRKDFSCVQQLYIDTDEQPRPASF